MKEKPLEKEYAYFLKIEAVLAREHDGKFVAIKNQQVLGIYEDYRQAANAVYAEHEYGTVLMQPINRDLSAKAIVLPARAVVVTE